MTKHKFNRPLLFVVLISLLSSGIVSPVSSFAITASQEAQTPVWRIQLTVQMGTVTNSATGDPVAIALNSKYFWLDYGRNDFEKDSSFTYDVGLDDVKTLADIRGLEIKKTGSDGMCIDLIKLIINGVEIYYKFLDGADGCQWLSGNSKTLYITGDVLRSHAMWTNFQNPPPPTIISKAEMESRIESLFGNMMYDSKLHWDVNSGKEVEVSKKNSNTLKVDLDLKADAKWAPDPKIDTDFDLKFVCENNALVIKLENFDADSSFSRITNFVIQYLTVPFGHKIIEQIIDQIVEHNFGNTSVSSSFAETKCVKINIHDNGSVEFIFPSTAVKNGDWNNSQTWHNNKVPKAGDVKIIPNGISVIISSNVINYDSITNYGTITNMGSLANKPNIVTIGPITVKSDPVIVNHGTIANSGTLANLGSLTNFGMINIECGGKITGTIIGNPSTDTCIAPKPTPQPTPQPAPIIDADKDGIPDEYDECPSQPEIKNSYQDTDGCPDERPVHRQYDLSAKTDLLLMTYPSGALSENQIIGDGNKFKAILNFYNTGPNDAHNVVATIKSDSNWIHIDDIQDPNCTRGSSSDEIVCKYSYMGVCQTCSSNGVTVNFRVEKAPEVIGNSISVIMTGTTLPNETGGDTNYANNKLVIPFQITTSDTTQPTISHCKYGDVVVSGFRPIDDSRRPISSTVSGEKINFEYTVKNIGTKTCNNLWVMTVVDKVGNTPSILVALPPKDQFTGTLQFTFPSMPNPDTTYPGVFEATLYALAGPYSSYNNHKDWLASSNYLAEPSKTTVSVIAGSAQPPTQPPEQPPTQPQSKIVDMKISGTFDDLGRLLTKGSIISFLIVPENLTPSMPANAKINIISSSGLKLEPIAYMGPSCFSTDNDVECNFPNMGSAYPFILRYEIVSASSSTESIQASIRTTEDESSLGNNNWSYSFSVHSEASLPSLTPPTPTPPNTNLENEDYVSTHIINPSNMDNIKVVVRKSTIQDGYVMKIILSDSKLSPNDILKVTTQIYQFTPHVESFPVHVVQSMDGFFIARSDKATITVEFPNGKLYTESFSSKQSSNDQSQSTLPDPIKELTQKPTTPNVPKTERVPSWIKNNAGWWATNKIDDKAYVEGIQHMLKSKIIDIPTQTASGTLQQEQTIPTTGKKLDIRVAFEQYPIQTGQENKLKIDFLNPQTKKIQEHIDYKVLINDKSGRAILGPMQITHTSSGSASIPITFNEKGEFALLVEVEGILFQPTFDDMAMRFATDGITPSPANTEYGKIPDWVKNNAKWWSEGSISEDDFLTGLEYLIKNKIVDVNQ